MTAREVGDDARLSLLALEDPRWLDLVQRSSGASFFHHARWGQLLADCYGYRAMAAVLSDASGQLVAGVPLIEAFIQFQGRRWIALPFTDHCAVLGEGAARADLARAIALEARRRGVNGVELRDDLSIAPALTSTAVAVRHTLALSGDAGAVHARLSTMHQRNIRKAQRAGVKIFRGTSDAELELFYRLHLRTRRRHGVPVQPRRFFQLLQRRVIGAGHGFVVGAAVDGAPVAAAVFLTWNGVLTYKYGASDERWWQHRPNNLVLWSAIEWGCQSGHRIFDLGRSDFADQGLRAFKDGWGATEAPLVYSSTAARARAGNRPMIEHALAAVIRHGHPWLSRAVGELLYRYAA